MKIQQNRATIILGSLIASAMLAVPNAQLKLLAAEHNNTRLGREQDYIATLKSDSPLFDKAAACRQLALVGTGQAVPVLVGLLDDEILSDYARFALEPIEDPSVDEALRHAIDKLEGKLLAGVISSIGARRDAEAVGRLSEIARDPASPVGREAVAALGRIATDRACETILSVLSAGPAKLRPAAADACLAAAQARPNEAIRLYDAVRQADVPGHLRASATYGAIMARRNEGTSLLIEQLRTSDPQMVEIALRAARKLPGPEVTRKLVGELNRSQPILQVLLIKVLADRRDPVAYESVIRKLAGRGLNGSQPQNMGLLLEVLLDQQDPVAYESIKALAASDNPEVCIESLTALGRIGDASAVPVLIEAAGGGRARASAAIASLRQLKGQGVDQAIIEAMNTVKGHLRPELIDILADRRSEEAIPAFLAEAESEDQAIAVASLKALTSLSHPGYLPVLVELLAGAREAAVRTQAENAVVAAASRGKRTARILKKLKAADRVEVRGSLLRVLGRIGGDDALAALQNALKDKDEEIRDTAVRALAAWPDSKALDNLSAISQSTSNNTHRVLALRGYVRLLGLDAELSQKEKVAMYGRAMSTARSSDEKKLVLAGLANVVHPDALSIIFEHTDQPQVKNEAILAALKVAQATADAWPEEARKAAMRIQKIATSPQMRKQAKKLIEIIE